ncbi:hypothetical protein O181_007044 [Austropuccinia psidii MF-1]|uniref:Uncharacterized protein n=1 Tax=Austropuccinia psidii MF-1 TaxID=1389203 RepID=A0A9Q3BL70_9BASI|nr:hypothetical protein [Austropuccinia psidii MF-1]
MENKRFNLEFHWEEIGASCQKICLKEINFKDLMVIAKGWNPTRQFRLLEVRENRIRENKATIQAIEKQMPRQGLLRFLRAHKEEAKQALQWLHTIQGPEDHWPRVTICHNPRKFPGEGQDTRAKTRPLSKKGRKSQNQ